MFLPRNSRAEFAYWSEEAYSFNNLELSFDSIKRRSLLSLRGLGFITTIILYKQTDLIILKYANDLNFKVTFQVFQN